MFPNREPRSPDRARGPGGRRLASQPAPQVAGQFIGACVTARGVFFEALAANRLEIGRGAGTKPRGRDQFILNDAQADLGG